MRRKNIAVFEGIFVVILVFLPACRSQRHHIATLTMAQRQERELISHDTLWQQLSLHLEGLSLEWPMVGDSLPHDGTVCLKATHGMLNLQRQASRTIVEVLQHDDTMAVREESVETTSSDEPSKRTRHIWWWLFLGIVLVIIFGLGWKSIRSGL